MQVAAYGPGLAASLGEVRQVDVGRLLGGTKTLLSSMMLDAHEEATLLPDPYATDFFEPEVRISARHSSPAHTCSLIA